MDATQIKSDFVGFGPLPSANAGRSVGFVGAFAPIDIPTTRNQPQKPQLKLEAYSDNQQFFVYVDKHLQKSQLILGDTDGSPEIRLETDSVSNQATITSKLDINNVTYIDPGVVSIVAGGVNCDIDPSGLPSNALFGQITFATPSGGSETVWVLRAV